MESNPDPDIENDEKLRLTSSDEAQGDEVEGNWLNEVLTKDTA